MTHEDKAEIIEFIIPLDFQGAHISVSDTLENCFVATLKYLQNNDFVICGLMKTASGNHHDADWQDKYTIIGDGGAFSDVFDQKSKQSPLFYYDWPIFERIEVLSEKEMENWSKPFSNYDGEEKIRLIYATRKDKKQYIFETTQEIILPADKTYEYEWHEWDLHKKSLNHKSYGIAGYGHSPFCWRQIT